MTDTRYRQLIWIYVALLVAAVATLFHPGYSPSLAAAYEAEPATWLMSHFWLVCTLLSVFALTWIVGLIGLFRFKTWARPLSLYSTIAGYLIYPFLGASLESGLENALLETSATLWGAILALSYFSAVSDRFGR